MIYLAVIVTLVAVVAAGRWFFGYLVPLDEHHAKRKDFDQTGLGRGRPLSDQFNTQPPTES